MRRYFGEITGLWRALAREGPAARSDSGVSLPRQLWELLVLRRGAGKLHPNDYYKLRVYRRGLSFDEKRKYFSNQAIPANLTGNWAVVARDKLLAYCVLNSLGIATPTVYAICHPLREYGNAATLKSAAAIADYLRGEAPYPLIVKPIRGSYSQDVWLLEGYDRATGKLAVAGSSFTPEEFGAHCLQRKAGCLFQELLRPHEDIRSAISDRLCTLRVMLTIEGNEPRLTFATWKISTGPHVADNYWREGNLIAKLDQETGRILHCATGLGPRYRLVDRHPKTGLPLAGFQVPFYRESIDLALRASAAFADIRIQAWDIAITDARPVPLEVNSVGSLFIPQLVNQQGLWAGDFRDFVQACRRSA
ncbi:MAG TPA: sugar-transfer associated ATP-grasp domain-containing protein [Kiloniellaceae bacterium]